MIAILSSIRFQIYFPIIFKYMIDIDIEIYYQILNILEKRFNNLV